jgi:hypothetical protein
LLLKVTFSPLNILPGAETKRQESIINAKRDADVSKINMEKMLNEKESEKKRAIIESKQLKV